MNLRCHRSRYATRASTLGSASAMADVMLAADVWLTNRPSLEKRNPSSCDRVESVAPESRDGAGWGRANAEGAHVVRHQPVNVGGSQMLCPPHAALSVLMMGIAARGENKHGNRAEQHRLLHHERRRKRTARRQSEVRVGHLLRPLLDRHFCTAWPDPRWPEAMQCGVHVRT